MLGLLQPHLASFATHFLGGLSAKLAYQLKEPQSLRKENVAVLKIRQRVQNGFLGKAGDEAVAF